MRSELGKLTDETIQELRRNIPDIAARIDEHDHVVRESVVRALTEFVDRVADPRPPARPDRRTHEVYRALGRDRMLAGRDLEGLQAAYRLGARLAWRRWVELGRRTGVPAARMYELAEAVLVYIDELATSTAEGYREAQRRADTDQSKHRKRLFDFLVGTPDPPPATLMELSRSAQWPLPESVVAVALRPLLHRGGPPRTSPPWRPDALVDTERAEPCMLLPVVRQPDPEAALETGLRGWRAAIGPTVPVTEAATSLRWARKLLELAQHGLGDGRRIMHCDDHLSTLLLLGDLDLLKRLAARHLAPLADLTPKQRDRMAETMQTWLECDGSAPEVARRMHVHPQTVRYRLRRIEDLYGRTLRDPDARFDLKIALRVRGLLERLSAREART